MKTTPRAVTPKCKAKAKMDDGPKSKPGKGKKKNTPKAKAKKGGKRPAPAD